ncbi:MULTISPECIES: crotonase/enoyl-CoA hydratase family protein [Sphingopyxis]|uniref:Enoyl-CoA hydratase n=1 Tax=Sphingopyxis witflariensis TaxID=173675 RepID=A0A246K5Y2_9SPHN|nr:crotonase/enoyl-CoA hydratase family protein [Sphingopyxis witflariensis]OWR01393.1 enoyl-CoA hydratase [Sphingopyxis witflariensis]
MGEFLSVERRGKIAILTMIKPDSMNAIGTHEDCDDIIDTMQEIGRDRSISAIILTGSGKAFSAGGNLKGMKDRTGIGVLDQPDSTRSNYRRGVQAVIRALMDCEIPMIAAINGHAIGLGADLACTCDIRIAAESAKFACSFVKVGIVPGDGGAWLLQKIVGYPRAAELFLTGDRFDAQQAKEYGLVTDVVPDEELLDRAVAIAERIVCNPPRALRLTKRLLREAQHSRMSDILELSAAYQAIVHETADNREAIDAFIEKRAPVFTGE